jgi:hypothetical protein
MLYVPLPLSVSLYPWRIGDAFIGGTLFISSDPFHFHRLFAPAQNFSFSCLPCGLFRIFSTGEGRRRWWR